MISGFDFNKLDFVEMKYIMQLYADETAKESFTKILEGIFGAKLKMFLEDFDKDSISFEIYNYDDNNHTIDKVLKLSNFDCEIFNMRTFQGSGFEKVVITPDDDKLLLFEVKKAFRKFMLDLYKDDPDYAEILKSHMEDEMNNIRLIYDYDCDNWAKEYEAYFGSESSKLTIEDGQMDFLSSGEQLTIRKSSINPELSEIRFKPYSGNEPAEETELQSKGEQLDLFTKGEQMNIDEVSKEKKQRGEE